MHKSIKITLIVSSFLILNSFFILYNINLCSASGDTLWVDDDVIYPEESDGSLAKPYKDIQSAIAAATDGDTIAVLPGTYIGDIVIDKSITVMTQEIPYTQKIPSTVITSGAKNAYLIDITADSVSLEGFTIRDETPTSHRKAIIYISPSSSDVSVINNYIDFSKYNVAYAIYLESTQNAVIKNNFISDHYTDRDYGTRGILVRNSNANTFYGNNVGNCTANYAALKLESSNGNIIESNTFRNSTYGIYIQDSSNTEIKSNIVFFNDNYGIAAGFGSNNIIESNSIHDNGNFGIGLSSSQSNVFGNSISSNGLGIILTVSGCIIRNNIIYGSKTYSIYTEPGSNDNIIYNNTLTYCYGTSHAREEGNNQWDYGGSGNYWDDYYGPDNDEDGFGDIPYTLGGVIDNYPTGIFQQPPLIKISTKKEAKSPSPSHLEDGVALQPTLSVKVEDPEDGRMDVYFYYILDNESHLIDMVSNVESGSEAAVPFFSMVKGQNAVYTYLGHGYDYICVWYVVVIDQYSQTKSPEWIFTTRHIPIDNEKPMIDAGGPYLGQVNEEVFFDGSGCYDPDGSIEFYRWSFGDGTSVINVENPTHIYQESGRKEISLIVIDDQGSSSTATTYVDIESPQNDPPLANAGGYYTVTLGDPVQFSSIGSYDPDEGDFISSYYWDFNDGTNSTEANPIHIYSLTGNYTITLTVTDNGGLSNTDSTYVIVIQSEETSGFTIFLVVFATLFMLLLKRKRR